MPYFNEKHIKFTCEMCYINRTAIICKSLQLSQYFSKTWLNQTNACKFLCSFTHKISSCRTAVTRLPKIKLRTAELLWQEGLDMDRMWFPQTEYWSLNALSTNSDTLEEGAAAKATVVGLLPDTCRHCKYSTESAGCFSIWSCCSWFTCSQYYVLGTNINLLAWRSRDSLSSSLPGAQKVTIKKRSWNGPGFT